MFDATTFETLLIPQISCGDEHLRETLMEKFNFLYLKNRSSACDDRWIYVRLQLDLIELARMTTRKKIDFLKRIEDSKNNRFYNAGGFMDTTASKKSEGFSTAFSRARSNQDFYRFSESHDKARSDSKAEHHGLTESKAQDYSRSENKAETTSTFQSNAQSAGVGQGASCSASKSESTSSSTTGSMQPFNYGEDGVVFPKLGCAFVQGLANDFSAPLSYGSFANCITNTFPDFVVGIGGGLSSLANCIANLISPANECSNQNTVRDKLNERFNIASELSEVEHAKNMNPAVPVIGGGVGIPQVAGFRTYWSPTAFPEIFSGSPFDAIAGYSAEVMTRDPKSESCNRAYITPSSGRSWQMSYRFGVSFGLGGNIVAIAGASFNFNVRTQISMGNSYKESEVCTTGNTQRLSDSKTTSSYKESSNQVSQGHGNTTDRSSTKRDVKRRGMSKRDAYSKHSSCSYSTMDSTGRSHTDSNRVAGSKSTGFGSGQSRKEGHSHGEGKSINRTQAILEARSYSQIFSNLTAMLKRVQAEFDEVILNQSATLGSAVEFRDDFEWCGTSCNNFLTVN